MEVGDILYSLYVWEVLVMNIYLAVWQENLKS